MSDTKRILITGGTGFIGSRLALACLERGDTVRVLGQTNHEAEKANSQMIRDHGGEVLLGSVTDVDDVRPLQGVQNITLAASVRPDDACDTGSEIEIDRIGKALETGNFDAFEKHRFGNLPVP